MTDAGASSSSTVSPPAAAWRLIRNLDGSFRGYEWALGDDGKPIASRVYAQEGRDDEGRLLELAEAAA